LENDGELRVDPALRCETPAGLLDAAVDAWSGYHASTVVLDLGETLRIEDPNLLLFYQNRLLPWAEKLANSDASLRAAREIAGLAGGLL
ncbi:MAG: hypothetical protein ACPG4T_03075, partial [Nannocystaceae bacterium]